MPMMGWGYNGYGGYGGYGAWNPFGFVWAIFWIIVVVLVVVVIVRWALGSRRRWRRFPQEGDSALNILRERYAKGEIDKKEFEERKRDLGGE